LLAPRAAAFIAASSAARERLLEIGAPPERVEVSIQSADVGAFLAAAERRAERSGPLRILCVSRLVEDKNQALLIRAFAAAGTEGELLLCGSGPLEASLRRQAEGLPVRFLGYVAPEDLPELYAEVDALALVSTYEPFGVAAREAAAAGLPIICSRIAGAAGDVAVEGENALLVDPEDEGAVADAIRRLLSDADLRARLAAGSRAVTERTPLERDAEAFERAVLLRRA
jgi:glycosyltransferase involved in cell wall biosynthesis